MTDEMSGPLRATAAYSVSTEYAISREEQDDYSLESYRRSSGRERSVCGSCRARKGVAQKHVQRCMGERLCLYLSKTGAHFLE